MRVTKITLSLGRTINTGNFNSIRVDCTLEAVVEGWDDMLEARERLRTLILQEITMQEKALSK